MRGKDRMTVEVVLHCTTIEQVGAALIFAKSIGCPVDAEAKVDGGGERHHRRRRGPAVKAKVADRVQQGRAVVELTAVEAPTKALRRAAAALRRGMKGQALARSEAGKLLAKRLKQTTNATSTIVTKLIASGTLRASAAPQNS